MAKRSVRMRRHREDFHKGLTRNERMKLGQMNLPVKINEELTETVETVEHIHGENCDHDHDHE